MRILSDPASVCHLSWWSDHRWASCHYCFIQIAAFREEETSPSHHVIISTASIGLSRAIFPHRVTWETGTAVKSAPVPWTQFCSVLILFLYKRLLVQPSPQSSRCYTLKQPFSWHEKNHKQQPDVSLALEELCRDWKYPFMQFMPRNQTKLTALCNCATFELTEIFSTCSLQFIIPKKTKQKKLCSLSHWSLFYSPNIRKHLYKTLFGCNQIVTKSYVNINFIWYKSVSIDLFILSLFYHLWNNVLCCYRSFEFINF